jgi:PEP-CTERM motif-containing protein
MRVVDCLNDKERIKIMTLKAQSLISWLGAVVMTVFLLSIASVAQAGPYVGVTDPVGPGRSEFPPPPERVPGKEYSHEFDKDAANNLDSTQNIAWDGVIPSGAVGGGVADTFDYDGQDRHDPALQVDAIANQQDALFFELIGNQAAALFSERLGANDQGVGLDTDVPIYFESTGGAIGPWATALQVDQHGVTNLDGLEVWGLDGPAADDANRFSLFNDLGANWGVPGVSVWTDTASGPAAYIYAAEIAAALGVSEDFIDVDAMMTFDLAGNDLWELDDDWIIFSLWPDQNMDPIGDEVWVWQNGHDPFFLNHGGHVWDSGWLGTNIDALEAAAVPEPGTIILVSSGLLGLVVLRKKFRKS